MVKAAGFYSIPDAARALGLTPQAIGQLMRQDGSPSELRRGHRLLPWPKFPDWYHAKLRAEAKSKAREQPSDLKEIDKRQKLAELTLAEIEAATAEGKVITVEQHAAVVAEIADRLRSVLINLPSNYQVDLERAGVSPEKAQAVLERIADGVTVTLRTAAEELVAAA